MTEYRHNIEKYIKGELSPVERHALEKKALSDPFLADALEGAEKISDKDFSDDVASLKENVLRKKSISVWMWPARIAAGLAIIAVSTYIVWTVTTQESMQDLALQKKEQPFPSPVTTDSITHTTEAPPTTVPEFSAKGPSSRSEATSPRSMDKQIAETNSKVLDSEYDKKIDSGEKTQTTLGELPVEETNAELSAEVNQMEKELDKNYKTDDIQEARKLAGSGAKKKAMPSSKDSQPSQENMAAKAVAASSVISGRVTSAEDGAPLPGINVIIKGTTQGTATDENGNYRIMVLQANVELIFSFIGLQSTEVKVGERNEVNVQMKLDVTQLSEVVVTGYGSQSDESPPPTINLAHPETGNRSFKQYLEKNIHYPEEAKTTKTEGRVTVEFTIQANGSLTDFTVLHGIGSGCDEELIRLIKEGPKWVPTKNDGMPVQDKASVRLKFVLPK